MDLDSPQTLNLHKELINNKKFLKNIYIDFYSQLISRINKKGKILELGSGAGFIKDFLPKSTTSDVIKGPGIDKVFSATKIPYKDNSLDAILMINTLHHIKNPEVALLEMQRVLKKGGKILMIEPFNSFWSKIIYQNFHHETFNPKSDWRITGQGRLSAANGAVPWIIFIRDQHKFLKKFPNLKITQIKPHTPFRYLLSGGLSKPQFLPNLFYPLIYKIEQALSIFANQLAMFATIEIKKIK